MITRTGGSGFDVVDHNDRIKTETTHDADGSTWIAMYLGDDQARMDTKTAWLLRNDLDARLTADKQRREGV